MLVYCPSFILMVDATRFHSESCYAFLIEEENAFRKFKLKFFLNHSKLVSVSTEPISNLKHHHGTLIMTSCHWDLTEIHHLLPVVILQLMD